MFARCNCGKRKIIGRGWVDGGYRWYCPDCWARELEKRRKREAEDQKAIARGQEAYQFLQTRLELGKRCLLSYSLKEKSLPDGLASPAACLAKYGLQRLETPLEVLARIAERETLKLLQEVQRYQQTTTDKLERELQEIVETLGSLSTLDPAGAIQALARQCLDLLEVPKGYWEEIDPPVKALVQLNAVNRARVYPLLLQAAGDLEASQAARYRAIIALGEIGDRQAVEPLLDVLDKAGVIDYSRGDSTIRNAACALAVLGDERAVIPVLRAALQHFGSGGSMDWKPRHFLGTYLKKLVIPGSAVHQQVFGMQAEIRGSLDFWDQRIEEMIDNVLGIPESTHE